MQLDEFKNTEVDTLLSVAKIVNGYWVDDYPAKFRGLTKSGRVKIYNMITKKNTAVNPYTVNGFAEFKATPRGRRVLVVKSLEELS